MFEQILQLVKDHLNSNPQISSGIPKDQEDAIHQEIATHINNGVKTQIKTKAEEMVSYHS